uniref:Uncharacterized protein n=1 Tax=Odontella aurita TaxID=265563 RepID=A0A7S4JZQ2_9STRA
MGLEDGGPLEKAAGAELDNFSDETARTGEDPHRPQPSGQSACSPQEGEEEHRCSGQGSCGSSSSSEGEQSQSLVHPILCSVLPSMPAMGAADSKEEVELVLSQDEVGLANSCSSVTMGANASGDESDAGEGPRFTVICDMSSEESSEEGSTGTADRSEI